MTPKRRKLLLVCCILALIAFFLLHNDPGPSYNGKTLHAWLKSFHAIPRLTKQEREQQNQATAAIAEIGTNALPYLIKWILPHSHPSTAQKLAAWAIKKIPAARKLNSLDAWADGDGQRDFLVGIVGAFQTLGSSAAPAIPGLLKIANAPPAGDYSANIVAIEALRAIGPAALPALASIATDTNSPVRTHAIDSISYMGSKASTATPALIACLADDNSFVVQTTVMALGRIRTPPELVVPALINVLENLHRTNTAHRPDALQEIQLARRISDVLRFMQFQRNYSAAALVQYLKQRSPHDLLDCAIIQNIGQLAESPEILLPLLIDNLNSTNTFLYECSAMELPKLGPAASSALPALTNALQNSTGIPHLTLTKVIRNITSALPPN